MTNTGLSSLAEGGQIVAASRLQFMEGNTRSLAELNRIAELAFMEATVARTC